MPSPYTPIQDLNELMPGFLLKYDVEKKLSLHFLDQEEEHFETKKLEEKINTPELSWKLLLEELYKIEQPNSLLFFPKILELENSYFLKQKIDPTPQKSLPSLKFNLPTSKAFKWISLWILRQRSHNKDLLEFESSPYCFFKTHEIEKHAPALKKSFDLTAYLAKIQSENGLEAPNYLTLFNEQNTFFHFANTNCKSNTNIYDSQILLDQF